MEIDFINNVLEELNRFETKGEFTFQADDQLGQICNAPREGGGIYLLFNDLIQDDRLIYVGISGSKMKDDQLILRKDGLGGRIVNGKQFGENRRRSWPKKMNEDGVSLLRVRWYLTFHKEDKTLPRKLEELILNNYFQLYGYLPDWNKTI